MAQSSQSVAPVEAERVVPLRTRLRRAERRQHLEAVALVAPLFVFLLVTFAAPIVGLLRHSVDNDELRTVMPRAAAALRVWHGAGLPPEGVYEALGRDLAAAREERTLALVAKRLNHEIPGFRSLLLATAREVSSAEPTAWKEALLAVDAKWADPAHWAVLRRAAWPVTPFYLLAALDLRLDTVGTLNFLPEGKALYLAVLLRTFWMSFVVTVWCLALGYPVAYLLATLPARSRNLLLILVLLPFYTSLLVRTTAWVVLLQQDGLVNTVLMMTLLTEAPLQLVFNRIGVYVAMVHILLPYMILPVFSVMKGISPDYMRAATSLGANPAVAFARVYFPQTMPGVGAGCLLVFILAIGYYITPALLGGPQDQMLSYFVAYFTNTTINWSMAAALGTVLLVSTLALYAVYARLVGIDRMRLG